jgi:uncharacterized protein (UPF0297 family)
MALRPEIALQTQGIKLPDFAGAYESVLNNRARRENLDQNRQLHQAQMKNIQAKEEQRRMDNERQANVDAALKAGDMNAVGVYNPKLKMEIDEAERKAQADQIELAMKQQKALADAVMAVKKDKNPGTFMSTVGGLMQSGVVSEKQAAPLILQLLNGGWTPDFDSQLDGIAQSSLSVVQQLEQKRLQAEEERKQAGEGRAVQEFNATLPGKAAESRGKVMTQAEREKNDGLTNKDVRELDFKDQTQQDLQTYRANSLKISQQNANRIAASQDRSATQNQVTNEAKLRDDFSAAAKPFKAVSEAFTRVMAADGDKGVNDIALIYGYMKMLDPGSVVREGEFATAANAAGIPDRITTLYNNAINGSKLSQKVRQEMKEQARQVYKAAEEDFAGIESEYKAIAERSGVGWRNVIVNFRSKKGADATQDDGTSVKLPNGRVMKFPSKAAAEAFKKDAKL